MMSMVCFRPPPPSAPLGLEAPLPLSSIAAAEAVGYVLGVGLMD